MKRKGSRKSSHSKRKSPQASSSVRGEAVQERTLEESRQRLWLAIPTVAAAAQKIAEMEADLPPPSPTTAAAQQELPPVDKTASVMVPWADMAMTVRNLYLATHGNPTSRDIEAALSVEIGTAENPLQLEYSKADINTFMDSVLKKWIPGLKLPQQATQRARVIRQLNQELVDCITFDNPPHYLLDPEKVFMIQQTALQPTMLVTPIANFITFTPPRSHPMIFDRLWHAVCQGAATATFEQFQAFFTWMYSLHFSNTTVTRARKAAMYVWNITLNERGDMCIMAFQRACTRMCRHYAQRRDTAAYLEELVRATELVVSTPEDSALFFKAGGLVTEGIAPRQILEDPKNLYIPDEMRFWHFEEDLYESGPSPNRVFVYGVPCVGKTAAGEALAKALHSSHLEVLPLAVAAAERLDDVLGKQLLAHVKERTPIPLSLQAALVRRELVQPHTVHHGFVFSDDIPFTAANGEMVATFLEEVGLASDVLPAVFVEVTCEERLHCEWIKSVRQLYVKDYEAELKREAGEVEKARVLEERAAKRAGCQSFLDNLAAAQAEENETTETNEEEQAALQQQAKEAEETLAALDAEDDEEAARAEADAEREQSPEYLAKREADRLHALEVRLRHLIYRGRAELCQPGEAPERVVVLPCMEKALSIASDLQRVISVEGASASETVTTYVMETLGLSPTFVAVEPGLKEAAERDLPGTVAGDEELGRLKEEATAALGVEPSHIWKHFCPVTFSEEGFLVEGVGCYSCVFRNRVYYMTSSIRMKKFMASPFTYLRQKPADRQRVLLVASEELVKQMPNSEAVVASFAERLAETLLLTKLSLSEYTACLDEYRAISNERAAVLATRSTYEETERRARMERQEKRSKLNARQKRTKARKLFRRPSTVGNASVTEVLESVPEEADLEVAEEERLEHLVAQQIDLVRETRKNAVPVLVTALHEEDVDLQAFDLVYSECLLPENVIVLSFEAPEVEEDGTEEQERTPVVNQVEEEVPEEEVPPPSNLSVLLTTLSEPPQAYKKEKVPQSFEIHTINMFGIREEEALCRLIQSINPTAIPVGQGTVDEEEEDEDEEDEEDEEDDGEGKREPQVKEKVDPMLQPRRRFLHQFGSRLQFCPVTLFEQRLLVRGRNEFTLKFLDELYCFATSEAVEKFTANPFKYIEANPPGDIPPRVWMVGADSTAKCTLAAGLARKFGVPYFSFSRSFLEKCIEAATSATGAEVEGILIPADTASNPCVVRGAKLLKELRDFDAEQKHNMQLREEAEKIMEEREKKEEERANRSDDEESEEESELNEDREEELQERLEFEPEDEEDAQVRLTEAYLRIASCVMRIEPFESSGYIMATDAFGEDDLALLFTEGGIPEVVVHLTLAPETYEARLKAIEGKNTGADVDPAGDEDHGALSEMNLRQRERALRRWRRRHIGANDPPSEPDDEEAGGGDADESQLRSAGIHREDDENEPEDVEEFLEAMRDRLVDVVIAQGDLSTETVLRSAADQLQRHFANRLSFFYVGQVVFYDDATKMLSAHQADLSSFDHVDPVLLLEERAGARRPCEWKPEGTNLRAEALPPAEPDTNGDETSALDDADEEDELIPARLSTSQRDDEDDEEMSEYGSEDLEEARERWERKQNRAWKKVAPRCVLLRHRLYFFKNDRTLKKFLLSPLQYILQPPPAPATRTMPVVSIFEDDIFEKAGARDGTKRRSLAESVAYNTGAVFLSISKLLSWAALNPFLGCLGFQSLDAVIQTEVHDVLVEQLLLIRLACADVKAKGAVLMNLPRSASHAARIAARPCCAPLQKTVVLRPRKGSLPWADSVVEYVDQYAFNTLLPVPRPSFSLDAANLSVIVAHMDAVVRDQRDRVLREMCAFPIDLRQTYYTRQDVRDHKASYRWYCPYCWVEQDDLVYVRTHNPSLAALFLGRFYFFSEEAFLQRFLLKPYEVADPVTTRQLPPCLPEPLTEIFQDSDALEYQGCCPVLLFDTREQRGLRGVLEPSAKPGSLSCVVRYDQKLYACLNEENKVRFLKRPWQYVDGAFMPPPRKCPLTKEDLANGISDDYFMRRQLYDYVAYAMLAVAQARPRYPGLSAEESAIKFMSLHMKAHRESNNAIEQEQSRENLSLYETRSTLYRKLTVEELSNPDRKEYVENLCLAYEGDAKLLVLVASEEHSERRTLPQWM